MTPQRMARIHVARGGICEACGLPVPPRGAGVRYDHRIALELDGPDTDDNIRPLHRYPCDQAKTAEDLRRIAKVRRIVRKATAPRTPFRLASSNFGRSRAVRLPRRERNPQPKELT